MDPAATVAKRVAIRAALADRDLGRLRKLAADEGGFVDQELRQAVWPFLLGLDVDRSVHPEDKPPLLPSPTHDVASTPSPPPSSRDGGSSSSSSNTRPSTPQSPTTSFIDQSTSSLDASVTSLAFGSPSASLSFLPSQPTIEATTADDGGRSPSLVTTMSLTSSVTSDDPSSPPASDVSTRASLESDRAIACPATAAQSEMDWGLFGSLGASQLPAHIDEGQIKLDTRRSFVVYPRVSQPEREQLQLQLHAMLLTVFRRHPALRYFQGYHDIASVFLLTYLPLPVLLGSSSSSRSRSPRSASPAADGRRRTRSRSSSRSKLRAASAERLPATQLEDATVRRQAALVVECVERLSLHRIRDGMGLGLEPVMGLLRVMNRVLKSADPDLARTVSRATPLPFFALSWLLTLFAHDVDSESVIQLVFDFLLAHNPVMAVYLTVAIVLSKKALIDELQPSLRDDPGLLHSTLSALPVFIPSATSPPPPVRRRTPSSIDHLPAAVYGQPPLALPALFASAEALLVRFPPDSAAVRVSDFMGIKSVVLTYEAEQTGQPISDAEAEQVVNSIEQMVNVDPPLDDPFSSSDDDEAHWADKKARSGRTGNSKEAGPPPASASTPRISWPTAVAVALFAGAVSIAVYNTAAGGRSAGGGPGSGWVEGGRRLGELAGVGGVLADAFLGGGR